VYPDARNEFAFPELLSERGLAPHSVPETWIMAGPNPKHFVDTTDMIDKKIEALLCHASQHQEPAELPVRMRGWGEQIALAGGLPAGRTAEAFLVVDTK
jgi:LmbE family N-acetylglucosaminyl deacetylase